MAIAHMRQEFPDGNVFEILVDSDLDTLKEVAAEALDLWRSALVDESQ